MSTAAIVACEMIDDETHLALARAFPDGGGPPVVWVESSLHERPERLKDALQELVDRLDAGARTGDLVTVPGRWSAGPPGAEPSQPVTIAPDGDLILGFGYCGGGLKGLVSRERRLVFPRADDCISLFLDGHGDRGGSARDVHSYYLTKGWFCHSSSISDCLGAWVERYGPERAKRLRDLLFANYQRLSLIDTGAYEVAEWLGQSESRAAQLGLAHQVVPGSVQRLEKLFAGHWGTDVVVLEPGQPAGIEHLLAVQDWPDRP